MCGEVIETHFLNLRAKQLPQCARYPSFLACAAGSVEEHMRKVPARGLPISVSSVLICPVDRAKEDGLTRDFNLSERPAW